MGVLIAFILLPVCVTAAVGTLAAFPIMWLGLWFLLQVAMGLEKLTHSIGAAVDKSVYWIDATIDGWLDKRERA